MLLKGPNAEPRASGAFPNSAAPPFPILARASSSLADLSALMAQPPGWQSPSSSLRLMTLEVLHGHSGPIPEASPTPGLLWGPGSPCPAALGSAPGLAGGHAAPRSGRLRLGGRLLTSRDSPAPGPALSVAPPSPTGPAHRPRPQAPARLAPPAAAPTTILTVSESTSAWSPAGHCPPAFLQHCLFAGPGTLLLAVRESFRRSSLCRFTFLPASIGDSSSRPLQPRFYPACSGRPTRCVTPTWADPARTSLSAAGALGSASERERHPGEASPSRLLLQSA